MKIQVLGTGCKRCVELYTNVEEALKRCGIDAELEKIQDISKIVEMGVLMTPGIAIDGMVVASGRLFSVEEIIGLLEQNNK